MGVKLNKYIRYYPRWTDRLPIFTSIGGSAIYPFIFLKYKFYENLLSSKPNRLSMYVLIHEQTHINRAKEKGPILWMLMYFFVPSFRVNEELAADREAMKFWKLQNLEYDFDRRARYLSGPIYFWPISYEEAKKRLMAVWEMI